MNEVLPKLRAVLFSVGDDGLVATNERMMSWLRGTETHRFVGTDQPVPITLVDFDDPRSNRLVVSTEVTYGATEKSRYDIVLFINGLPLVVGETKTPIKEIVSWLDAAKDIHTAYEQTDPRVLRPNVLSFASEGRDLRYGAVGQPPELWLPWARTTDEVLLPGMAAVLALGRVAARPRDAPRHPAQLHPLPALRIRRRPAPQDHPAVSPGRGRQRHRRSGARARPQPRSRSGTTRDPARPS